MVASGGAGALCARWPAVRGRRSANRFPAFNGEENHVHLLVHYPPKVQLSKPVNSLKGVSARYRTRTFFRTGRNCGLPVAWSAVVTNWMGTLDPSRTELVTQAPGHLAHEGVGARLPAGGHL
jgi:hypothetical protein